MSELITTGIWSDGGRITERRTQDVEPILEMNKELRSTGQVGGSEFRHAAKIPFSAIEAYMADKGINLHEF